MLGICWAFVMLYSRQFLTWKSSFIRRSPSSLGGCWGNCSDDDKSMKICTHVGHVIRKIFRGGANANCT